MAQPTIPNDLDFFYDFFLHTKSAELTYIYRGIFTQAIIKHILSLTETNIDKTGESVKVKKRVYLIMVEGLQNITRHQELKEFEKKNQAIFLIQKIGSQYHVTTGNAITNDRIEMLGSQIEKVNSLNEDELKVYYREVLTKGKISDKGGAGLGLIEMARKSGNKLLYKFQQVDDRESFFYLRTEIFSEGEGSPQVEPDPNALEGIEGMQNILEAKNILIAFNGIFSQESLLGLLSIIESQMADNKNVYNIIVEMLQNIVRHGISATENPSGNEAMFLIREQKGDYLLSAGNFIKRSNADKLRERLDYINSLDDKGLQSFYNLKLLDFETNDGKESGLGFAEMRLKTKKKLLYCFREVDDEFSFFTIQAAVPVIVES